MMFPRLRLMNRNQRGFTLIELMVAIAISSVITGGITMTIFQVIIGSARTNNHMIAVRQAQNAGYWVSHDAQMAQSIRIGDDPATPEIEFLTLKWTDWDDTQNVVTYTREDMIAGDPTSPKQLKRSRSFNGTLETSIAAQFIDPANTKCEAGGAFTLPDSGDAFTITGGTVADSGTITVTAGSISLVSTSGGASYNATTGAWATPAGGGTVVLKAGTNSTAGVWTSATASAKVAITADVGTNGAASVTVGAYTLTVTVSVGGVSQRESETRIYEIVPRPG
jgi:prepilin-type N-terminal cleavage/methylation domain-containing protein